MRILVVSNFYPPYFVGGYELGCSDVVEALKARGHEVCVLTSTHGLGRREAKPDIYRWLDTDSALNIDGSSANLLKVFKKESTNQLAFRRLCRLFAPEAVYIWNATQISISIAFKAQQMGLAVYYFVSDHWLVRWKSDAFYSLTDRSPKRLHRRLIWGPLTSLLSASSILLRGELDLSRAQFSSAHLKHEALEATQPVSSADVIHWGVDVERFPFNDGSRLPKRLLYVGQLTSLKGTHTAIEALKNIVQRPGRGSTMLTIVGGPDYDHRIHRLVVSLGLEANVRFTGLVPRERLPDIYRDHDILLFPSIWDEPFSITLLEAMSSGLAVVGTNTGGSAEILKHDVNALIFPKADADQCARQITRLIDSPELFERIRRAGRSTVEKEFRLERMIDRIDTAFTDRETRSTRVTRGEGE